MSKGKERGGRESACAERMKREGRRRESRELKMSGLYREEPLGEGQLRPWAGKFGVGIKVCQVGLRDAGRTWKPALLWYVKYAPQPLVLESETKQTEQS